MIKVKILTVGTIKEKYLKDALQEYVKRISAYAKIDLIEVQEAKIQNFGEEKTKEIEGKSLLKRIEDKEFVILIDLHGKEISSESFASKISNLIDKGVSPITFVIAGTLGYSQEVVNRANDRICFSQLTFPHQIVRVLLVEQIYRAFKIINNESYHH